MRSVSLPPRNVRSKPRPALSPVGLLQEHQKIVLQLTEAVREVSALLREMNLLLASHAGGERYQ